MMRASNLPIDLGGSEIRVIGPRRSGKTVYMAALARWPNASSVSPIQAVDPYDSSAGDLILLAQDILEDGRELAGSEYFDEADELPVYTLLITLNPNIFRHPVARLRGQAIRMQVSCREYAGELIKDLRNINSSKANLDSYLEDCTSVSRLLLIIDGSARSDREYAQAFDNLQRELNDRLMIRDQGTRDYRVAVLFTKCEQPTVWIHRNNVQNFVNHKFPATQKVLRRWQDLWKCQINYFFCSAFGTKGTPPRPNFKQRFRDKGGVYGVIATPEVWKPIGLVAPLYWLQTGHEDPRLRDF